MIAKAALVSGGRTSGFMLHELLRTHPNYREEFVTIFCNTGKERQETLDFVHEMETRWNVPFVWLEYDRKPAIEIPVGIYPTKRRNDNLQKSADKGEDAHWFKIVDYETASRNGEPFDKLLNWMSVLPNVTSRACSVELKIRAAMRYMFFMGIKEHFPYIGIRNDESHRSLEILTNANSFEYPQFPLIESRITEKDVLSFWDKSDFNLQLETYEGNCDLCFLKAKWKRVKLVRENPLMAQWWKAWEQKRAIVEGNGKFFRLNEPYALIEELSQIPLHPELDLDYSMDQDIPCSCAEKGFAKDGDNL